MSFSVIQTFQRAMTTLTSRLILSKPLQTTASRGIHQICSQYSAKLTATNSQNIFKPLSNLLAPTSFLFNQVCGLKVKGRLQLRCRGCYYVSRQGRLYVMCRLKPRHKQTQMMKSWKKTRILTFAHQKKVREW